MQRFLALGDSYTIGEGVDPSDRWPNLLASRLRAAGFDIAAPEIIATTGWTTSELDEAITAAGPSGPYELVCLLAGVNDQYRGLPVDGFRARFGSLLRRAIGFGGDEPSRVVVVSIPDWGVTPFAREKGRAEEQVRAEIDAFNDAARAEAVLAGARFVDVTPASRDAAHDPSLLAPDGLHPSGAMYRLWVELIEPAAREALGE